MRICTNVEETFEDKTSSRARGSHKSHNDQDHVLFYAITIVTITFLACHNYQKAPFSMAQKQ